MKYLLFIVAVSCLLSGCANNSNSSSISEDSSEPTIATTTQLDSSSSVSEPTEVIPPTTTPEPIEQSPSIEMIDGVTYVNGIIIANKTYPLPADYAPGVNTEAEQAFQTMKQAAANEGLNIYISSSFRSYQYQEKLYNNYIARDGKEKADTYSARPGHSEHQTGFAFDLNTIDDSFANTPEAKWVAEHAHEYGFIVRYPADKTEITGFKYEPWHIRYLGVETATKVYQSGLCLEEYLDITSVYA